jgi:hypothetical protein
MKYQMKEMRNSEGENTRGELVKIDRSTDKLVKLLTSPYHFDPLRHRDNRNSIFLLTATSTVSSANLKLIKGIGEMQSRQFSSQVFSFHLVIDKR